MLNTICHRLELNLETLLIESVEKEKFIEKERSNSDIKHKEVWAAISNAYDFIKNEKPQIEEEISSLRKQIFFKDGKNIFDFSPISDENKAIVKRDIELNQKLNKEKTRVYCNIVKYRNLLL